MSDDEDEWASATGCLVVIAVVVGFIIGGVAAGRLYRSQAIEHGNAEHDRDTGRWKWIDHKQKDAKR